ncbi:MAG: redoxin family protein [Chitinophagales bacterium]
MNKVKLSKRAFLMVLSLMITLSSCSQKPAKKKPVAKPGHKIVFKIKGLESQELLLAYHHSGKHYISDTIKMNEQGVGTIAGDDFKEKGVYLAVIPSLGNKYFEFLISDQYFTVETNTEDIVKALKFTNSPENEIFTKDMNAMADLRNKTTKMREEASTKDEKTKKATEEEITALNKAFLENRDKIVKENPDMFYTDLLGLMKEIEIPEPPKKDNGELVDSSFGWKYWKKHYWDYTDFSEAGILRTPLFYNKLMDFMTKRTAPIQDSVIVSARKVIDLSRQNDDVFQYTLVTLLNKYANSKIMGDDAVYVDLVKNYYETGLAYWTDSAQLAKMLERANALEPLLLGSVSPELTLRDTTLKMKYRLHDLPSDYTIVFVWDPECGHCKKSAPVLRDFYEKYKDKSILVYSIATINYQELDAWKGFIKEKNLNFINVADPYVETNFRKIYDIASTPQIFVLDKDKKIIAKRIGASQLEEFFFNYFKRNDKVKFEGMEGLTFEKADSTDTH